LGEGVVRVEMEEVFVAGGGGDAKNVVELLPVAEGHGRDHVDGSVSQINKGRYDIALAVDVVQLVSLPQRHYGTDELDEVLLPFSILSRTTACVVSVLWQLGWV
jgi:hypothetical protein